MIRFGAVYLPVCGSLFTEICRLIELPAAAAHSEGPSAKVRPTRRCLSSHQIRSIRITYKCCLLKCDSVLITASSGQFMRLFARFFVSFRQVICRRSLNVKVASSVSFLLTPETQAALRRSLSEPERRNPPSVIYLSFIVFSNKNLRVINERFVLKKHTKIANTCHNCTL